MTNAAPRALIFLFVLAFSLLAASAFAATAPSAEPAAEKPSLGVLDLESPVARPCLTLRGPGLCLDAGQKPLKPAGPSRLTRFTRLAGMFMGRTDAFALGGMIIRLKIDIR